MAVAIILHLLAIIAMLLVPEYVQQFLPAALVQPPPPQQEERRERPMFVFVEPKADLPPLRQPERVEMSDVDRSARSPEAAPKMENPLPMFFSPATSLTERKNRLGQSYERRAQARRRACTRAQNNTSGGTPPSRLPISGARRLAMRQKPQFNPAASEARGRCVSPEKIRQRESSITPKVFGHVSAGDSARRIPKGVEFGRGFAGHSKSAATGSCRFGTAQTMRGALGDQTLVNRSGASPIVELVRRYEIERKYVGS